MIYTMKNEYMMVEVESRGGEVQSIKDCDGIEYIWQADAKYWSEKAPHLFPFIGRFTQGKYTFEGQEYEMGTHGFLKNSNFIVESYEDDKLILIFESNFNTRKQYPCQFVFYLIYRLEGKKLTTSYMVENKGFKDMYFAVGGHPGFNVPLEAGLEFTDYYLEFAEEVAPKRVTFSDDCFVMEGEEKAYLLEDGTKIPLMHHLFDQDAIILKDMCHTVTLKSGKGDKCVTVGADKMDYMGFWHRPNTEAPYVCIEPWSSLPARKGVIEEFSEKPDLIKLEAKSCYSNTWWLSIG